MAFVRELSALGHRQLETETRAAEMILSILDAASVSYTTQKFYVKIPLFKKAELIADGKSIPAIATSFVSGKITNKRSVISSLISSQRFISDTNINFNPCCKVISRSNHYFAPSLAIAPKDLTKIFRAKKIVGEVVVVPTNHQSMNIIVGNKRNPRTILFCHYDSIGPGATDNAAGTAVLLSLILERPDLLNDHLFVIAGNEELSYDKPLYWGHGYRVFEKKYKSAMRKAKKLYAVDCVGDGKTVVDGDVATVRLGFPISNLKAWKNKCYLVYGSFDALMTVYHSDLDLPKTLKQTYLLDSVRTLVKLLKIK